MTKAQDTVAAFNASDPARFGVYGPGCEKSLARYRWDCNCRSCRKWRAVRGYR
jgi:hypothetical protein